MQGPLQEFGLHDGGGAQAICMAASADRHAAVPMPVSTPMHAISAANVACAHPGLFSPLSPLSSSIPVVGSTLGVPA
jgi:hypothetical protein